MRIAIQYAHCGLFYVMSCTLNSASRKRPGRLDVCRYLLVFLDWGGKADEQVHRIRWVLDLISSRPSLIPPYILVHVLNVAVVVDSMHIGEDVHK